MAFGSPASGGTVVESSNDDFEFCAVRMTLEYRLDQGLPAWATSTSV